MTESKTLDEWFEGKDRGDGRKFKVEGWGEEWFEPIFKDRQRSWSGLGEDGCFKSFPFLHLRDINWHEYHPPKKTKKVKMYMPVFRYEGGRIGFGGLLYPSKTIKPVTPFNTDSIHGWHEIEVEIEE